MLSIPTKTVEDHSKQERGEKDFEGAFTKLVGLINPKLGFFVNREAMEDNNFIDKKYIDMDEKETTTLA
jgi:hypothetical protein